MTKVAERRKQVVKQIEALREQIDGGIPDRDTVDLGYHVLGEVAILIEYGEDLGSAGADSDALALELTKCALEIDPPAPQALLERLDRIEQAVTRSLAV